MIQDPPLQSYESKFFIMSKEFTKNISDWRCDCTDYKNGFDFFLTLVKWPKLAVKKSQIFNATQKKDSNNFWRWKLTLKIRFWHFLKSILGHLTSLMKKFKSICVISAIISSIWNVFIKFRWHDEKLTVRPLIGWESWPLTPSVSTPTRVSVH